MVVAIENFGEQDFLCSENQNLSNYSGLASLCSELVRFTHFFLPTDSTQSNLASLLSGREFYEHRVTTNGTDYLPAGLQTFAEVALSKGYRTSLLSGGLPLLPKWGVQQGFENYTDGFDQKPARPFRSFQDSIHRGFRWLDDEVNEKPFLSFFYVPDLLHEDWILEKDWGEERPINRTSQLQDLHESLNQLVLGLKQRKRWDNLNIIIVGVSGEETPIDTRNPLSGIHLHVPLQIKLQKNHTNSLVEKTGQILTATHIYNLIVNIIQNKDGQNKNENLLGSSKATILHQATQNLWLDLVDTAFLGLRTKQYLLNLTPKTELYDSFADRKEIDPLPDKESLFVIEQIDADVILDVDSKDYCIKQSHPLLKRLTIHFPICKNEKSRVLDDVILLLSLIEEQAEDPSRVDPLGAWTRKATERKSKILSGWLAHRSLKQKNWGELFELGKSFKNQAWQLVAQRNLNEPVTAISESCLFYLSSDRYDIDDFYRNCQDSGLKKIVEGILALRQKRKPSSQFWAEISNIVAHREAKELNLKMNFINDVKKPFEFHPKLSELFFYLPENRDYLKLIDIR